MTGSDRPSLLQHIADPEFLWDMIVIGGGATGLGTALDAASRGFKTLLVEQSDFAKGTSSRSTKLVHGGVRYLASGDIGLVMEALTERALLLKNAPHLVKKEAFIIPCYSWWAAPFYFIGLSIYDLLAGRSGFGRTRYLVRKEVVERLANIRSKGLYGGILYYDGQFDDSRLAINLAQTCLEQGATLLNYVQVTDLKKDKEGKISGISCTDVETGFKYSVRGKIVINATGVFADGILKMDDPGAGPVIRPSQGVHMVISRSFMPGTDALMIPETEDGRVLFAVPWHDKLVIGTTDTPVSTFTLEPRALDQELEFIMRTLRIYFKTIPQTKDILSIYAGLRPLAAPGPGDTKTKEISRSHKIFISDAGLITITGGKWTTYRRMAEDTVNKAIKTGKLAIRGVATRHLSIHGAEKEAWKNHLSIYGTDQQSLLKLSIENSTWAEKLHLRLPYLGVQVIWGVRFEMARTVEDILARRTRALFLDALAALEMAPLVAGLMATELGKNKEWEAEQVRLFSLLAVGYLPGSQLSAFDQKSSSGKL